VLAISPPVVIVICGAATITDPALPLAVEVAKAMIPLPGSLNVSGPCAVTCTVPPLPAPVVAEVMSAPPLRTASPTSATATVPAAPDPSVFVEIAPPSAIERVPALILTSPAFPLLPRVDLDEMPVKRVWDIPSIVTAPATLTKTLPAFPEPIFWVSVVIAPSLPITKAPAVTETLPAFPAPNVLLWIAPLSAIDKVSAVTVTVPAFPLPWDCAEIPDSWSRVPDFPSIESIPVFTETLPPLPDPKVALEISPLLAMMTLPALTVTLPALPVLEGFACEVIPVK
jgi:hypothetical protein